MKTKKTIAGSYRVLLRIGFLSPSRHFTVLAYSLRVASTRHVTWWAPTKSMLSREPGGAEEESTEQQVVDQNSNAGMKLQRRQLAFLWTDTLTLQAHEATTFLLMTGKERRIIPDVNTPDTFSASLREDHVSLSSGASPPSFGEPQLLTQNQDEVEETTVMSHDLNPAQARAL